MTTKPLQLDEAVRAYEQHGVGGITVWRDHLQDYGIADAGRLLRDSSLEVVSLCRGGFFPAESKAERSKAVDENRRIIEEAQAIGAPLVVLVCGALPGMALPVGQHQIAEGIEAVLPDAEQAGVKLGIEPLHPMYADDRSAIVTLCTANDVIARLGHPMVGVTIDVYHVWWDSLLDSEIQRASDSIFSFHVCDWRTPTRHLLTDRELMGEGCIDVRAIRESVEAAGFAGPIEVEIFSESYWAMNQDEYLSRIVEAYRKVC